jgi:phosphinothricin acetyltransferase
MRHALGQAPKLGFKALIAILMEPNAASIALLKKFGFQLWGNMPGILEVDGKSYDHQYYGVYVSRQK